MILTAGKTPLTLLTLLSINFKLKCWKKEKKSFFFFFGPLLWGNIFFWTPSIVYISVIITHILQITNHAGPYYTSELNLVNFWTLLTRAPPVVFELLRKTFWRRAGFEPTKIERVLLSVHCFTSKPQRLDKYKKSHVFQSNLSQFWLITAQVFLHLHSFMCNHFFLVSW